MTRVACFVVCGSLLCLATATPAAADPVTITSGSIILSESSQFQAGPITVTGTRGFSIQGFVDTGEGRADPLSQCFPCEPTTNFSVGANFSDTAVVGSATLDGMTFPDLSSTRSNTFVSLQLDGTTVLPPVNGSSLVIRAPFTVAPDSLFTYQVTPGSNTEPPELATVALGGRGTATVRFHVNPTIPVWEFSDMRWDFTPTPEPSTLVLLGGGLAALWRARARKTTSSHSL
jgi:hypothetical protein